MKPAISTQDPDRQAIQDAIDVELNIGNDVVVMAHSYGGVPSSSALEGRAKSVRQKKGLAGGVIAVVYLATFLADVGVAMSDFDEKMAEKLESEVVRPLTQS